MQAAKQSSVQGRENGEEEEEEEAEFGEEDLFHQQVVKKHVAIITPTGALHLVGLCTYWGSAPTVALHLVGLGSTVLPQMTIPTHCMGSVTPDLKGYTPDPSVRILSAWSLGWGDRDSSPSKLGLGSKGRLWNRAFCLLGSRLPNSILPHSLQGDPRTTSRGCRLM